MEEVTLGKFKMIHQTPFYKGNNCYTLIQRDGKFYLDNGDGEAMELSEELLFDAMDKLFSGIVHLRFE